MATVKEIKFLQQTAVFPRVMASENGKKNHT